MSGVAAFSGTAWAQRLEARRAQGRAQQRCEQDLKDFESALGRAHTSRRCEPHRPTSQAVRRSSADGIAAEVPASAPLATPLWTVPLAHTGMPMSGESAPAGSGAPLSRRHGGPDLEATPPQPPAAGPTTQAGTRNDRWQFEVCDASSPLCRLTVQRLPEGGFQVALQTRPTATGQVGSRLSLQPLRRRLAGHGAWLDDPAKMEAPER